MKKIIYLSLVFLGFAACKFLATPTAKSAQNQSDINFLNLVAPYTDTTILENDKLRFKDGKMSFSVKYGDKKAPLKLFAANRALEKMAQDSGWLVELNLDFYPQTYSSSLDTVYIADYADTLPNITYIHNRKDIISSPVPVMSISDLYASKPSPKPRFTTKRQVHNRQYIRFFYVFEYKITKQNNKKILLAGKAIGVSRTEHYAEMMYCIFPSKSFKLDFADTLAKIYCRQKNIADCTNNSLRSTNEPNDFLKKIYFGLNTRVEFNHISTFDQIAFFWKNPHTPLSEQQKELFLNYYKNDTCVFLETKMKAIVRKDMENAKVKSYLKAVAYFFNNTSFVADMKESTTAPILEASGQFNKMQTFDEQPIEGYLYQKELFLKANSSAWLVE